MILNPPPWPNDARCAVAFTFDMDADSILHFDHHASADTRMAAMSMLRYGPEVAVPRILHMYKHFGMRQTFFLPAWCMERYPQAVEAILKDGHEIRRAVDLWHRVEFDGSSTECGGQRGTRGSGHIVRNDGATSCITNNDRLHRTADAG